jgi:protein-S-isoprenylcysteine O-methyltransferase Ste14
MSANVKIDNNQKIISTKPYKIIRHSMYTEGLLLLIFTPLAFLMII